VSGRLSTRSTNSTGDRAACNGGMDAVYGVSVAIFACPWMYDLHFCSHHCLGCPRCN